MSALDLYHPETGERVDIKYDFVIALISGLVPISFCVVSFHIAEADKYWVSISEERRRELLLTVIHIKEASSPMGSKEPRPPRADRCAILKLMLMNLRKVFVGAILLGTSVCIMHYFGMLAMCFSGTVRYDVVPLAFSVFIALTVSFAALLLVFRLTQFFPYMYIRVGSSIVAALAVSAMHYTGMAAASYEFNSEPTEPWTFTIVPPTTAVYIATIIGVGVSQAFGAHVLTLVMHTDAAKTHTLANKLEAAQSDLQLLRRLFRILNVTRSWNIDQNVQKYHCRRKDPDLQLNETTQIVCSDCLKNPATLEILKDYLVSKYDTNSLFFLVEMQQTMQKGKITTKVEAQAIFDEFIAIGSPMQVNLSGKKVKMLENKLNSDSDLFDLRVFQSACSEVKYVLDMQTQEWAKSCPYAFNLCSRILGTFGHVKFNSVTSANNSTNLGSGTDSNFTKLSLTKVSENRPSPRMNSRNLSEPQTNSRKYKHSPLIAAMRALPSADLESARDRLLTSVQDSEDPRSESEQPKQHPKRRSVSFQTSEEVEKVAHKAHTQDAGEKWKEQPQEPTLAVPSFAVNGTSAEMVATSKEKEGTGGDKPAQRKLEGAQTPPPVSSRSPKPLSHHSRLSSHPLPQVQPPFVKVHFPANRRFSLPSNTPEGTSSATGALYTNPDFWG
eukprot:CAMPEP_0175128328 /NCGR_PEP_ID=MMETSP0087-20121206/4870_1 /TAXON_ID=136419 /ORGANISM="Unknown Unknown, Strain D1" /LENGTH=668 /DNA_ID=CAMNT_0016410383 /DNA_START=301 /DNA_END=2307 /DNA_ORIENTATION=+